MGGDREGTGMGVRLAMRWIWRAYPRRWRARYGAELDADLRAGAGRPAGGWRLIMDALVTLPRVWIAEVARGQSAARGEGSGPERDDGAPFRGRGSGARATPASSACGVDLAHAWRSVTRTPGRAAVVVATLALALGANAAVFSVSWAILLRTLPYEAPDRLVRVEPAPVGIGPGEGEWHMDDGFLATHEVEAAGLYVPSGGANLASEDGATRLSVTQVDGGFFPVLGLEAAQGRLIGRAGIQEAEAVLSHGLWVRGFGSDPRVVGRTVELSGHAYQVVGVAPPDADFPAGTDVWASLPMKQDFYGTATGADVIARVRDPEALPALTAAHRARTEERWERMPTHLPRPTTRITPIRNELVGAVRMPLLALSGAAAAVLLLGCLNLMGIEVARTVERSGELGARRALGAGAGRLFRQLALEVGLLALAGGAAALAVAWAAGHLLLAMLPGEIAGLADVGLEPPVLGFTAAVTVGAALLVGLVPAARGARTAAPAARTGRTATPGRGGLAGGLVSAQVALAVMLCMGAALLARSLGELRSVPLGYDTESVLTFRVQLPSHAYPGAPAHGVFMNEVGARLAALPGVTAVGWASRLPLASGLSTALGLRAAEGGEEFSGSLVEASDGFFEAMGIDFVAGGPPTPPDSAGGDLGGLVIDRRTALRLFGEAAPVGRRLEVLGRRPIPARVAGVVNDVRLSGPEDDAPHVVYTTAERAWLTVPAFAVRTGGDPTRLVGAVRRAVAEVDRSLPPYEIRTTGDAVAEALAARRALSTLSGLFGLAALVLVALGLYGTVARSVAARRREMGIRLALGAAVRRVVTTTVWRAVHLVLVGLAVGLPAGLVASRLLRSLLFGVAPSDPGVAVGVVAVVLAVGVLAALGPAARAGRIDPAESLRSQ